MLNPRIFRGNQGRELRSALFFASPWFVGMALLAIGPIGLSAFYSFTDYHVMAPPNWVGLQNYQQLFGDPLFQTSLINTAYYTLLSVPLGVIASLGMALLVNRSFPGRGLVRAAFYAPTLVAGVALAMLWGQLFAGDYGLVNQALALVHLPGTAVAGLTGLGQAHLRADEYLGRRIRHGAVSGRPAIGPDAPV